MRQEQDFGRLVFALLIQAPFSLWPRCHATRRCSLRSSCPRRSIKRSGAIQDTVNEVFVYMSRGDKVDLRGSVKALEDVLGAHRCNWNNNIWRKSAHMKVVDIKQESERAAIRNGKGRLAGFSTRAYASLDTTNLLNAT